MIAVQLLFTYAPFMQTAFQSRAIGYVEWGMIIGISWLASLVVGLHKRLIRQSGKSAV